MATDGSPWAGISVQAQGPNVSHRELFMKWLEDLKEVPKSATFWQDDHGQVTYLSVTSFLPYVSGIQIP